VRDSIPARTPKSKYAKSYLYHDYNDIDFFIEDTDKNTIKILLELIQRSLSKSIKVSQLFPLGGRDKVKDKYINRDDQRKQIFIIDGDLYLLFENTTFQKGLVSLEKYCIENYLLDENAIHELLYQECSSYNNKDLMIKDFSYNKWFKKQDKLLSKLFLEYAIEKKNKLGLTTIKYNVARLQKKKGSKLLCELDNILINKRIKNLKKEIKTFLNIVTYSNDRLDISSKLINNQLNSTIYVSSKDYIFPLIFRRIKKFANTNINDSNFLFRLSQLCSVTDFKATLIRHV